MAINDVSLTSGMRSNLLSLQGTVDLLNRTQNRLSTGKKVNTAIDNPVSFFASQALNSRASVIDSLKDAMGQAVQTIQAADKGIKAITAMIEQAKGIAQSALSADSGAGTGNGPATITLSSFAAGSVLTIGGQAFTATGAGTPGTGEFYIGGTDVADAQGLAAAINANGTLTAAGYSATASGNVVTISNSNTDVTAANVTVTAGATAAYFDPSDELSTLQAQFNEMRNQIDDLAADAGYKGKNLLSGDTTLQALTVKFEGTHQLAVTGFDASTTGLQIAEAAWTNAASIETSITSLDTALTTLRQEASSLSGNLSIITVRQDFSNNMINTLTEGADKLTLADTNEEGANMLMLQTRQSLSTTALSLSAQAAQSVLRLFG
ncbi:MAG TPA: hypothetical protein PK022_08745 [Syntrophales bacterium]|nr:hypothetical protein [Syntrophales bacterium]